MVGAVAEIGDSVDAGEELSDELLDPPPHAIAHHLMQWWIEQ